MFIKGTEGRDRSFKNIIEVNGLDDLRRRKYKKTSKDNSALARRVDVKYVESMRKRQQIIYKRRSTLFKKAKELGVMAGAQLGLVYKEGDKTYTYFSSNEMKDAFKL